MKELKKKRRKVQDAIAPNLIIWKLTVERSKVSNLGLQNQDLNSNEIRESSGEFRDVKVVGKMLRKDTQMEMTILEIDKRTFRN